MVQVVRSESATEWEVTLGDVSSSVVVAEYVVVRPYETLDEESSSVVQVMMEVVLPGEEDIEDMTGSVESSSSVILAVTLEIDMES